MEILEEEKEQELLDIAKKTKVIADTPDKKEAVIRWIVKNKAFRTINGMLFDLTTAGAVLQVMDAISPENKLKFLNFNVEKIVSVTWKLLKI